MKFVKIFTLDRMNCCQVVKSCIRLFSSKSCFSFEGAVYDMSQSTHAQFNCSYLVKSTVTQPLNFLVKMMLNFVSIF